MRYVHAPNIRGLKAGNVYALNREYALNNGVHLTTRVYVSLIPLAALVHAEEKEKAWC